MQGEKFALDAISGEELVLPEALVEQLQYGLITTLFNVFFAAAAIEVSGELFRLPASWPTAAIASYLPGRKAHGNRRNVAIPEWNSLLATQLNRHYSHAHRWVCFRSRSRMKHYAPRSVG